MGELRRIGAKAALAAFVVALAGCGSSTEGQAPSEPRDQPQQAQQPNPPEGN